MRSLVIMSGQAVNFLTTLVQLITVWRYTVRHSHCLSLLALNYALFEPRSISTEISCALDRAGAPVKASVSAVSVGELIPRSV